MPGYKRPGTYAEEILAPSTAVLSPNSGLGAFFQAFMRGPTTPKLLTSWTDFTKLFGGFGAATDYLPHAVHQFFSNGGRQCYVYRVAGTGAVKATRTLLDRAGTPLATLRVDALNEGVWGNQIYLDVVDQGTDRFNLIVKYGGATDAYIVERWTDLSMLNADSRFAEAMINHPTAGSSFISVADLNSISAAPLDRPSVQTGTALATGVDGAAPTLAQMQAAVPLLDVVDGPLTINIPGSSDTTLLTTALAYVDARGDSFLVIDPPVNNTAAQAITFATGLPSSNGALYFPWIYVSDPASTSATSAKKIPPGGSVVGQYARTETMRGIHKAPAGLDTNIAGALGVELRLTNTDLDSLNPGNVNAIRQIPGAGVVIFGTRTLWNSGGVGYVPVRRTLNYIKKALIDGTLWAVFEPNDATLWSGLRMRIEQFLLTMWRQGALRGASAREAFYVKCDAENNDPTTGVVNIEVGLALQFPAEFVVIRIGQWEGGYTASEAA